ncbi:MAG TPA: hypothetical protein VGK80_00425, partial [Rhodanobacteraceae bacterium]
AGKDYAWEFTDVPIKDPQLDQIRLDVLALETTHPSSTRYVDPDGEEIIRSIIRRLQSEEY